MDNVDVAAATEHGIVVMNAPGGNTVTTAEHAVSLMLSLARNIPQATASMREGKWEKKLLTGVEITGKTRVPSGSATPGGWWPKGLWG